MARTMTMAPQASHPAAKPPQTSNPRAAKPPPTKHPAGKAPAPHKPHPARRGGLGGWATVAVIGVAVAGAGLWYGLDGPPAVDSSAQLQAQMMAAAQGEVVPTHVFGGALTVTRANGRTNVVAEAVPSRACVQVGWKLAREGTIIVNGILSSRLSAAKLSEMCSGEAATLMWVPEE